MDTWETLTGRKLHPQVEPRFLPLLGGDRLALLDQAVQVEGRHGLEALQRLRDVAPKSTIWSAGISATTLAVSGSRLKTTW